MFLSPLKKTFDVLNIQLIPLENQKFPFDKFLCSFTCACSLFKYIQITIFIKNILVNKIPLWSHQKMQMVMTFDQHRIYGFLIIFLNKNNTLFPFQQMRILYEGFYTQGLASKKSYYGFFSYHKPLSMKPQNPAH